MMGTQQVDTGRAHKRNGQAMQIDLMVLNDDAVILVEVRPVGG